MKRYAVAVVAVLAVASVAHAKGIFQAEGSISALEKHDSKIAFRFAGHISFGYATGPAADPKRQWKDIEIDATDILVNVGDWTKPFKPAERGDADVADQVYEKLSNLAKSGRPIRISLDNPSLSFSNVGQLVGVSGTFIYAVQSDEDA